MGLMDAITSFEEETKADEQHDYTKCEHFRYGENRSFCILYEEECYGCCDDWELGEFWVTKKGY